MLSGLTPVGVIFVVVVLTAMTIGVSTAVYYAWIAPCIARQKLKTAMRKYEERMREARERGVPAETGENTARDSSHVEDGLNKSLSSESLSKEKASLEEELAPPAPAYLFPKRFRFSTSTQDGVWWFV